MITFRDTGVPATEVTGAVFIISGGLTLDSDSTGLPRLTLSASGVGGSGSTNKLPKWTASTTLGDSLLSDDGSHTTVTTGDLIFSAAASRIRGGATSFAVRNNGNSADNLLVSDAGLLTVRAGVTLTTADLTITAGKINFGLAASGIVPGATSFSIRNNANTNDNLLVADAGTVTTRGTLTIATGNLTISATSSRIVPGSTSLALRNNANNADNLLVADNGAVTIRNGLTMTAGGITASGQTIAATTLTGTLSTAAQTNVTSLGTLTALTINGLLSMTVSAAQISGGATSLSLRNNANNADNILIADAGGVTFRAGLSGITTISMSSQLTSTLATGTAPFVIASTTKVSNLNVDLLDGLDSTAFALVGSISGTTGTIAKFVSSSAVGNSIITESGTTITIADTLVVTDNSTASSFNSGQVNIGAATIASASLNFALRAEAGKNRHLLWQTGTASRWMMRANSTAESGSDAGSDFDIYRYSDAAAATLAIQIRRSDGRINLNGNVIFNTTNTYDLGSSTNIPKSVYAGEYLGTLSTSRIALGGTSVSTNIGVYIQSQIVLSGSTSQYGLFSDATIGSAGTATGISGFFRLNTEAAAFTLTSGYGLRVASPTVGSGSAITTLYGLKIDNQTSGGTNYAIHTGTGLVSLGDDLIISTLGRFDSGAAPSPDYSLVYDSSVSKWRPRLITASLASSGVVSAGILPDGTAAMRVNTISAALSGTPTTPTTIAIEAGYKAFIVTMAGIASNQVYLPEHSTLANIDNTGTATGAQTSTTLKNTSEAWSVNQWTGYYVYLTGGTGAGQWRSIASNTSDTLTINTAWGTTPVAASTTYEISGFRVSLLGTATGGGTNTLDDTSHSSAIWETNSLAGYTVLIRSGTGAGQYRLVVSNTGSQLVVTPNWTTNPNGTSVYVIATVISTADKYVHGNLDDTKSYYYRYRLLGATASSYYPTSPGANTVSTASQVVAFGLVLANQIAVGNLAAIAASASNLTVGSLTASAALFRQWQSSTTSTFGSSSEKRLWVDGPTLTVKGDTSATDTNRVVLGNYSYATGTLTLVTDTTFTNNAPSISASAPTGGTFLVATQQPANTVTPATLAYDSLYILTGNMRINTTITAADISGFTGGEGRVELEYRINSGAWSTPIVIASSEVILNNNTNYTYVYPLYAPTLGASQPLDIRLSYKVSLSCTKVTAGSVTVSGDSSVAGVSFNYYTATGLARRGLYISAVNSQPHLSLQPISTAPTSGNTQSGEVWFNGSNNYLEFNSNGTVFSIRGDATGSVTGQVRLTNCLGGTATAPDVVALKKSSAGNITVNSSDPVVNYGLIPTSTTVATWQKVTPQLASLVKRSWFGWRMRNAAGVNQPVGDGCYDPEPAVNGAGSSIAPSADGNQNWMLLSAGAASGRYARFTTAGTGGTATFDDVSARQDLELVVLIKTSSSLNSQRVYIGFTDQQQTGSTAAGNYIGWRLEGSGTTANGVMNDGTGEATVNAGTFAASTTYLLKVRTSGTTAYFSINGGAESSVTTKMPASATALGVTISNLSTSASATSLYVASMYAEYGI